MTLPLVSVIIPTFNSSAYIKQAINSVLNQKYLEFEIIIIDGGSSDLTLDIIDFYKLNDSRFKLIINNNDQGPAHARNIGILNSTGSYIAFLDADDIWKPDKLLIQINLMIKKNIDFSYTLYNLIGDKNSLHFSSHKKLNFYSLLFFRSIACSSVICNRILLTEKVMYYQKGMYAEDYLWWLNILKNGANAHLIPFNLLSYRINENGRSKNLYKNFNSLYLIFRNHMKINILFIPLIFLIYFFDVSFRKLKYILFKRFTS
jgi:teichuronic acid biosynthesis glycosyltransferase TuaG